MHAMDSRTRLWAVLFAASLTGGQGPAQAGSTQPPPRAAHVEESTMRIIRKEVSVSASLADVWHAWTTTEGVTSFGPPQADVELRVGGKYEWYFLPDAPAGSRGGEGCTVLSYLPMKMLSFTWNAPPSIPKLRDAGARTHVVIEFEQTPKGRVRVTLSQLGFGQGEAWDRYYAYFDRAWGMVLEGLEKHFEPQAGSLAESAQTRQHGMNSE